MRSLAAIIGYVILVWWTWKWIEMEGDWVRPVLFTGTLFLVAMYIVACEHRRIGWVVEESRSALFQWNEGNRPPLPSEELMQILDSSFGERTYEYGCGEDGMVNKMIGCSGKDACQYYARFVGA